MRKIHFWKGDGIVTLIATLLGVFLALYLNEWNTSRKQKKQKEIATENILQEVNANKEKLQKSVKHYEVMLETYIFFTDCLTSERSIVTSVENMSKFKTKHPGIIYTLDSIKIDNGNYRYTNMDLNLGFTLEQMELRTIAWETLKSSNINSTYSFDNLMSLQYIYKSIDAIIQMNNEIYNDAKKFAQSDVSVLKKLIFNIKMAIHYEKGIIDKCGEQYERLKNRG
ncbi:MAG: hypothetical protein JEZ14_20735 [Marinilabiliaceae bacterium]|nr:hypothetical protein [Marinilabiliaceae bacterium]